MSRAFDLHARFVVVGSGIAGLRAAVELTGHGEVVVLTRAEAAEGSTGYAQGGIAAAIGDDDSPALHQADTLAAGDGLCDAEAVRALVEAGPSAVGELMAWGAAFDRGADGRPALAREAAHSVRRVLHARDTTGREIGRTLWRRVHDAGAVAGASPPALPRVIEHARVTDLVVENGECRGVVYRDAQGAAVRVGADAVLLATGGAGRVFRETSNPPVATGDGIALAWRAGAVVRDLEFVQFHPTVLHVPGRPRFLLSEALRGEGARLLNGEGEAFAARYEPEGDLAARDKVARAMLREARRTGGPVFLSLAHLDAAMVYERFPSIAAACRDAGFDLARDPVPVSPAAHYVMGGVATDLDGRTSVPGVFAAGEVAATGVHGANRLASNSLLEGLVFGARAGRAMRERVAGAAWPAWTEDAEAAPCVPDVAPLTPAVPLDDAVRELMWQHVGVLRSGDSLAGAAATLDAWWAAAAQAARRAAGSGVSALNLVTVGALMARAAARRRESRGGHYRDDYPGRDDRQWRRHVGDAPVAESGDRT